MWRTSKKPPKASETEIVNAIVEVVVEKLKGRPIGSPIFVKVSGFPDFAQQPSRPALERIRDRLRSTHCIESIDTTGEQFVFQNRAKR